MSAYLNPNYVSTNVVTPIYCPVARTSRFTAGKALEKMDEAAQDFCAIFANKVNNNNFSENENVNLSNKLNSVTVKVQKSLQEIRQQQLNSTVECSDSEDEIFELEM